MEVCLYCARDIDLYNEYYWMRVNPGNYGQAFSVDYMCDDMGCDIRAQDDGAEIQDPGRTY